MKENQIVYNSSEISSIVSKISQTNNIIQTEIEPSLNRNFTLLQELDLFNEGLSFLKKQSSNVVSLNNNIISSLNNHDSSMNELEKNHMSLFDNLDSVIVASSSSLYSGEEVKIDEIVTTKINDGKVILTEYVNEVIPTFSYDRKVELLKNILNDNSNSLSILTDDSQADILIYQLKNILKKDYSIELSKLTKEEEKAIQKSFFESISDNDTNIFDEIDSNSFLHGLSYFKQVAEKKDTSASDIIFEDSKKDLFMSTINEMYYNDQLDVLTDDEMKSVKNYINEIVNSNNLDTAKLLSNSNNSSIIKGGIYYGD